MRNAMIALAGILAAATGASAQTHSERQPPAGRLFVGVFTGTDVAPGVASRTGASFTVEKTTRVENDGSVSSLSLRWSRHELGTGQRIRSLSPTFESRTYAARGGSRFQGPYLAGGFGLNFSRNSTGNHATHLVLSAGVGLERGRHYAEARWILGQVDGESGLLVGIGTALR